jgi:hypothetical protein
MPQRDFTFASSVSFCSTTPTSATVAQDAPVARKEMASTVNVICQKIMDAANSPAVHPKTLFLQILQTGQAPTRKRWKRKQSDINKDPNGEDAAEPKEEKKHGDDEAEPHNDVDLHVDLPSSALDLQSVPSLTQPLPNPESLRVAPYS